MKDSLQLEQWQLKFEQAEHNHPVIAILSVLVLPVHRQRTEQDITKIYALTRAYTKAHAILSSMVKKGTPIDI